AVLVTSTALKALAPASEVLLLVPMACPKAWAVASLLAAVLTVTEPAAVRWTPSATAAVVWSSAALPARGAAVPRPRPSAPAPWALPMALSRPLLKRSPRDGEVVPGLRAPWAKFLRRSVSVGACSLEPPLALAFPLARVDVVEAAVRLALPVTVASRARVTELVSARRFRPNAVPMA